MAEPAPIFRLMYRSELTVPPLSRAEVTAAIFETSRRENPHRAITGALLIWQEYVVQTLEGEEDRVRSLYEKIARDPRHEGVTILEAHHVEDRVFGRWSMARVPAVDQLAGLPPLSADDGEIGRSPGGEERDSDLLVSTMRGHAEPR